MAKYGWVFVDTEILGTISGPTGSLSFRDSNSEISGTYAAVYSTSSATVIIGADKTYFDTYAHTLGNDALHITGNVTISGTLEATQYHTNIVSSSVIYSSGSTKFGNSSDDIHQVTGAAYYNHAVYVTGAVTLGASSKIASVAGSDLTFDSAGDIYLDAAGDEIIFKDGSSNVGHISMASDNLTFKSLVSDKDIVFQGNDDGGAITALTLDMSEAGAATFNDKVVATELDISGDCDIDGTTNLDDTDIDGTLVVDGSNISLDSTSTLNIDNSNTSNGITIGTATSGVPISIGHSTSETTVNDNLTVTGVCDITDTTDSSDATGDTGALRVEGGASIAKKLYVGTDLDVDGTTNLDAVDIDGAVQIDSTVTVGVDDTGHDVKFFGATAGQYMLWDESADELVLAGDTKLSFYDAAGGEHIIASSDGHLEVNAGTTLDMTAPTVDINASTEVTIDTDTATFASANSQDPLIVIKNTTNDANASRLRFVKDKGAAGADDDVAGAIEFYADDDNQDNIEFARIEGIVADASNGAEGGKLKLSVATHDGELQPGLILTDGSAEDEVDVTIGNGSASVVAVPGVLSVANDIILDDGGSIKEGGGTAAITIDGSGHVTKIGQDTPSNGEVLTWDNSDGRWVASAASAGSVSSVGNGADNRVATFSSSDALNGEANLTFDGSTLTLTGDLAATGDTMTFTSANNNDPLVVIKNTANHAGGGRLRFVNDKGAAGADDDVAGVIEFYSDDDNQDNIEFARIEAIVSDASNGAEGGSLKLSVATHDGELQAGLTIVDGDAEDEVDVTIGNGGSSLTTVSGDLTVSGDTVTFGPSTAADDPLVNIQNNRNDATGARLRFTKDKGAAGAAGDVAGTIEWVADDANQDQVMFAAITGSVAVHTNGQEGGKLTLSVASHDGELQNGIVIIDGDAEDEIDVTIGNGASSVTTAAGNLTTGGMLKVGSAAGSGKDVFLYTAGAGAHVGIQWDADGNTEGTLIGGADDHGVDFKFFGETAGKYVQWDMSGDELVLASSSKLSFHDASGGENIVASSDGHLEINAGTTLDMTAATTEIHASTVTTIDSPIVSVESSTSSRPRVVLKDTTNDANSAVLRFVKDKGAAGAADDNVGVIEFYGDDANQDQVLFGRIRTRVAVHTDGQEGGKMHLSVASHDGELNHGIVIADGNAEDEVDVTIGNGGASLTTISGDLTVAGDTVTFGPSTAADDPLVIIKNTRDDQTGGRLRFTKDRGAAGEVGDVAGTIEWYADDANQDQVLFAAITGSVATHTNGQEGGKLTLSVASHDGELVNGIVIIDGNAEDEIDVTIGSGASSVITVPGTMDIAGDVDIAGDLTLSAGADGALEFTNASENSIKVPDNVANALIIEEANNAYMTFDTSNSSERVKLSQHTTIIDDKKLYFGTGEDWSIEYDEDGDDALKMAGTTFEMNAETITFTAETSNDPLVIIKNYTNDANGGILRFVKDKGAAGADNDICGQIQFYADDDNQDNIEFASIVGQVSDASNGAEGGKLIFRVASHDGEANNGLIISDGDAEDEIDVVIANGGSSMTTVSGDFTVSGDTVLFGPSTAADDPLVEIKNTRNDATGGRLRFTKDKGAAGAAGDVAGTIEWYADDANQDQVLFAAITGSVATHTNGQEGGKLTLSVASHDGELQNGVVVIDGDGEDRVDVTLGNGTASDVTVAGDLTVTADLETTGQAVTFSSSTANKPLVQIKNTTNDAASALLRFVKDKGSAGADNDIIGKIEFYGDDDNQDNIEFANIIAQVADASNGAEGGRLTIQVASNDGEMANGLTIADGSSEDAVNVVVGNSNNGCVITVDSDTGINFNHPAVSGYADDTGAGDILRDGTGTLTAGKLYFMHTGSAIWHEVDAKTDQSGSGQLLGIAMGSSTTTNGLLIRGFFDAATYLSGTFTKGAPVYMSTGAGYMQVHPPSGSDEQLRVVGHCTSTANVVYFNPSSTWIELD